MKTPFIWLGSGRAKKWDVAAKGRHLDEAAKAGLPVPPGAILLDELFQLLLDEGVVVMDNGRITAPAPNWLHETLYQSVRFPHLDKLAAVRSTHTAAARPQLNVDFTDPAQLSHSLCELWSQLTGRRDVLVMEMREMKVGNGRSQPHKRTRHRPNPQQAAAFPAPTKPLAAPGSRLAPPFAAFAAASARRAPHFWSGKMAN